MKYSNKLNLPEFFKEFSDESYCIIKTDDNFPNYYACSDIDIFCYDISKLADKIFKIGNKYIEDGFEIRVREANSRNQVQIDFYIDNKLDFKFDLYQQLPNYKRIMIKSAFFSSIIENRIRITKNFNNEEFEFYVPSKIDDLILRYIEYIEYYDIRADKIKHMDYINYSADKLDKKLLLDKLHFYTEIPNVKSEESEINSNLKRIKKHLIKFWKRPLKYLFYALTGKLDRI
jgi:hypothetical protein